jgi:hypothetical protein
VAHMQELCSAATGAISSAFLGCYARVRPHSALPEWTDAPDAKREGPCRSFSVATPRDSTSRVSAGVGPPINAGDVMGVQHKLQRHRWDFPGRAFKRHIRPRGLDGFLASLFNSSGCLFPIPGWLASRLSLFPVLVGFIFSACFRRWVLFSPLGGGGINKHNNNSRESGE